MQACETGSKRRVLPRRAAMAVLVLVLAVGFGGFGIRASQPAATDHSATAETEAGQEHEGSAQEHEGGGAVDTIARLVNFAIFIGVLFYLLKSPIRTYLSDRGTQIRTDLVNAAEMKRTASAQLAEIDQRMRALPGEIETLRTEGAREIAAEGERIRAVAALERSRLLEQARHDIDVKVRIAERELVAHVADLAVNTAAGRIKSGMTDAHRKRLVDRYIGELNAH